MTNDKHEIHVYAGPLPNNFIPPKLLAIARIYYNDPKLGPIVEEVAIPAKADAIERLLHTMLMGIGFIEEVNFYFRAEDERSALIQLFLTKIEQLYSNDYDPGKTNQKSH